VEGSVPRSEPRKLPFVRHRQDIATEEVTPLRVRSVQSFFGRDGLAGVTFEPTL
jgi:hypothetical protein